MFLKLTIMLLYARNYSITEAGKTNEGITVQYIITDNLNPVSSQDEKGIRVTKGSIELSQGQNIKSAPGIYEGEFMMKTGSDGKAALKLITLKYLRDVKTV